MLNRLKTQLYFRFRDLTRPDISTINARIYPDHLRLDCRRLIPVEFYMPPLVPPSGSNTRLAFLRRSLALEFAIQGPSSDLHNRANILCDEIVILFS